MIVEALYGWAHKVKYRHGLQGAEPLSVENLHNVVIKTSHLRFILMIFRTSHWLISLLSNLVILA